MSCFVFSSIDVKQLSGVWHFSDWQVKPFGEIEVEEVLCCAGVKEGGSFGSFCI